MKFDVDIERENETTIFVSVTHNGLHWTSLRLDSIEEVEKLYRKIGNYLVENGDYVHFGINAIIPLWNVQAELEAEITKLFRQLTEAKEAKGKTE